MKICMVTTFYPPHNFGGDGIFVYRLSNALAAQGHEIHVIHDVDAFDALSPKKPEVVYPNHPGITLHSLSSQSLAKVDLLLVHQLGRPALKGRQIKDILESNDFDVIHFHNTSLIGGPQVLSYGNAVKLCTLHECWFVCPMHILWRFDREVCTRRTCFTCTLAGHRPPQLWRYTDHIERSIQHVDAFISPSQFTADIHAANGFSAPIRHIPHFLPQSEADDAPDSGPPRERPYFLFAGRLEKIKGVQVLIDTFRDYHQADLVIAGRGNYEATLREMAADLSHVHFLGMIGHEVLRRYFRGALATLVPSICYESFGMTIIESFTMRTPAIVHNLGALPEVVKDGGGLTYDTPEELVRALEIMRTQPDFRNQLGEQGYQLYMSHYSETRHLNSYYDLIAEMKTMREGIQ